MAALGAPTLARLRTRRDEILRLAAEKGARDVRVFGSVVRGEARLDSDVDFLVVFDSGRSVFDLGDLEAELSTLLSREVHIVDLPPIAEMAPYEREVADRIQREAVAL